MPDRPSRRPSSSPTEIGPTGAPPTLWAGASRGVRITPACAGPATAPIDPLGSSSRPAVHRQRTFNNARLHQGVVIKEIDMHASASPTLAARERAGEKEDTEATLALEAIEARYLTGPEEITPAQYHEALEAHAPWQRIGMTFLARPLVCGSVGTYYTCVGHRYFRMQQRITTTLEQAWQVFDRAAAASAAAELQKGEDPCTQQHPGARLGIRRLAA